MPIDQVAVGVQPSASIVGFYSFKGGVGRTLAAAHMAYFYARAGKRVLLVDADFEAPGLSFWNPAMPGQHGTGLVQLLREFASDGDQGRAATVGVQDAQKYPIDRYVRRDSDFFAWERQNYPALMESCKQAVHLLPTGIGSTADSLDNYVSQLQDAQRAFTQHARRLKDYLMASGYDVVLVDSRTGLHNVGASVISDLTDHHVILFGPGRQNQFGFQAALNMLSDEQTKRSVFAMSPVAWDGAERLVEAEAKLSDKLRRGDSSPKKISTISWHPTLAHDEHLITATDPLSAAARNYQELFVELETVRGHGIGEFTNSIDALMDILKRATSVGKADESSGLADLRHTLKREFDDAFQRPSDAVREAMDAYFGGLQEEQWLNWRERAGFVGLVVWETVRRLKSLAQLDEYAAEALWGFFIRRKVPGLAGGPDPRYSDLFAKIPAAERELPPILEILYDEYIGLFGRELPGLKPHVRATRYAVAEITLEMFVALKGGQL